MAAPRRKMAARAILTSNHLGSTRLVTTGEKAVVARHDSLPFGEEIMLLAGGRTKPLGYTDTDDTRQKFTSKERDLESNLDFFEARYFSAPQGRFTSPDEFSGGPQDVFAATPDESHKQALRYADITNPQSMNKYGYVLDNPLRYVDPDGHQDGDTFLDGLKKLAEAIGLMSPTPVPDPTKTAMGQK